MKNEALEKSIKEFYNHYKTGNASMDSIEDFFSEARIRFVAEKNEKLKQTKELDPSQDYQKSFDKAGIVNVAICNAIYNFKKGLRINDGDISLLLDCCIEVSNKDTKHAMMIVNNNLKELAGIDTKNKINTKNLGQDARDNPDKYVNEKNELFKDFIDFMNEYYIPFVQAAIDYNLSMPKEEPKKSATISIKNLSVNELPYLKEIFEKVPAKENSGESERLAFLQNSITKLVSMIDKDSPWQMEFISRLFSKKNTDEMLNSVLVKPAQKATTGFMRLFQKQPAITDIAKKNEFIIRNNDGLDFIKLIVESSEVYRGLIKAKAISRSIMFDEDFNRRHPGFEKAMRKLTEAQIDHTSEVYNHIKTENSLPIILTLGNKQQKEEATSYLFKHSKTLDNKEFSRIAEKIFSARGYTLG